MDDLIEEAEDFDDRLKKMGVEITMRDLLMDKDDPKSLDRVIEQNQTDEDSDDSYASDELFNDGPPRKKTRIDMTKLGIIKLDVHNLDYLPPEDSASSSTFIKQRRNANSFMIKPKAPNARLELSL